MDWKLASYQMDFWLHVQTSFLKFFSSISLFFSLILKSINNTIVGTGLSSIYQSGKGIVGIGTTFVDNIYRIAQITTSSNLGIITCNIAHNTNVAGLAATGTESSPIGNFSWGKLTGTFSRSNPISIGVSGLTVDSGLTTFPTISRRDEGIRGTGAIIAE